MNAQVRLGEALGNIAVALGIHAKDFTRLDGRARNMLREYPGQQGWEPLLDLGVTKGQTSFLAPNDVLALYLALKLNLSGVSPSVAIPAVKRALARKSGSTVEIDLPAYLGSGSLKIRVEVSAFAELPGRTAIMDGPNGPEFGELIDDTAERWITAGDLLATVEGRVS